MRQKTEYRRQSGRGVDTIHRHGMQVMGGFIVGFDHDPENIFDMQVRFIQQIGVVTAMVGILTALPQTRLWHRLKAEGRLLSDASGENTDGGLNFEPVMEKEKLIRRVSEAPHHPVFSQKLLQEDKHLSQELHAHRKNPSNQGRPARLHAGCLAARHSIKGPVPLLEIACENFFRKTKGIAHCRGTGHPWFSFRKDTGTGLPAFNLLKQAVGDYA